jgi:hypothetical protein
MTKKMFFYPSHDACCRSTAAWSSYTCDVRFCTANSTISRVTAPQLSVVPLSTSLTLTVTVGCSVVKE